MNKIRIRYLLLVLTIKPFLTFAQEDIRINSRIDGKILNLTYQKPASDGLGEGVLFIHGASFPSALASGFRMNGVSWADHLSNAGYDVYAMDFLGYGKSDRYNYMSDQSERTVGSSGGTTVIEDIDLAIDFIRNKHQVKSVHLIGHSWGATVSAYYATVHPDKVDKLILFAPIVQRQGPTTWDKPNTLFIDKTPRQRVEEFISQVPVEEEVTLESEIYTTWKSTWLESDPSVTNRDSVSVRYPSAWLKDLHDCWNAKCFFDASKIINSTLLIRGEWDSALNGDDADKTYLEMRNAPHKKYVVIEKGTHVLHLEKNRHQLYNETLHFLKSN